VSRDNRIKVVLYGQKVNGKISHTKYVGKAVSGKRGLSAYDVWLLNGNEGTVQDFLESLSLYYKHTQETAREVWTIEHNLGIRPSVTIVDSADRVVYGDVEYIDDNTIQVSFNGEFSGKAYLS